MRNEPDAERRLESLANTKAVAAALLLTSAAFSPAMAAEYRGGSAQADGSEPQHAERVQKKEEGGWLRFAVDCGAAALVLAAFKAINLQDDDFRKLEIAMAQRHKAEMERAKEGK